MKLSLTSNSATSLVAAFSAGFALYHQLIFLSNPVAFHANGHLGSFLYYSKFCASIFLYYLQRVWAGRACIYIMCLTYLWISLCPQVHMQMNLQMWCLLFLLLGSDFELLRSILGSNQFWSHFKIFLWF